MGVTFGPYNKSQLLSIPGEISDETLSDVWVRWAVVLGGLLTAYPGWASGSLAEFAGDLGPDFLLYSAQGYLGVDLSEIDTDRVNALHLKDAHGAEVIMVDHDAPAGKSGLKVHDVILQLDGQSFDNVEQLRHRLREMPSGRTVSLLVSRDGNPITVTVQLCDRAVLRTKSLVAAFKRSGADSHRRRDPGPRSFRREPGARPSPGFLDSVMPKGSVCGRGVEPGANAAG